MLRSFTKWLLWIGLVAAGLGPEIAYPAPRNVVLVVADDHGLDAGCYGSQIVRTPHLDRLAAAGTRFEFAYCTTASCSPSRSVILTGLYNHSNGQYGLAHAAHHFYSHSRLQSLPLLLSAAGYRTCSLGKVHVEPQDVYKFDSYPNQGLPGGPRNGVAMAEAARRFIEEDSQRPFFVYFCPTDPHRAATGFANERAYPGVTEVRYDPAQIEVPAFLPDRPEVRGDLAEYYQAVSRADQGLGRLIDVLQETGHWDDTLLMYLSDNGSPFPGAKTTLYEPGVHLPLVVRCPGRSQPGLSTTAMVTWADLVPTILDFTGAKPPDYPLHGRSFLGALDQPDPPGWDRIFASHTFHEVTMYYPMRAVRTRKFKYILNLAHPLPFPFASDLFGSPTWQAVLTQRLEQYGQRTVAAYQQRPREELYDLESDPGETVNLASDPAFASDLAELRDSLRGFQERTDDPWLIKYQHE